MKTALIAGATGLVGKELTQLISKANYYSEMCIVTRRPIGLSDSRIREIIVEDFDQLANFKASLTADDIYCCLGTTIKKAGSKENFRKVDQYYPEALADLTSSQGASKFLIISSVGASKNSSFFYSQVKGAVEESISRKPFETVLIFRPSLLLGKRNERRLGEDVAQTLSPLFSAILFGSLKKYRPIHAREVASGMLIAAQKPLKGVHIFDSYQIKKL